MNPAGTGPALEAQIAHWRQYVRQRAVLAADTDELEGHLRDQIDELTAVGLDTDEAFLVAVKRMGRLDAISHEFAREHSERLWRQLVLVPEPPDGVRRRAGGELGVVLLVAVAAALAVRACVAWLSEDQVAAVLGPVVLAFPTVYLGWKRRVGAPVVAVLVAVFGVVAAILLGYPFEHGGDTLPLAVLHGGIVLWLTVGLAYVGGAWASHTRRMDFVRFTGELVVYYVLLGLGGGALIGLTTAAFATLDLDVTDVTLGWLLPCGAAGAVVVAAWLVEVKQDVIENIAPVLTRVFTPLATVMLLALCAASVWFATDRGLTAIDRELLILMDLILVLVLGLLLYAISARDPLAPPGLFDRMLLVLVVSALAVDVLMLASMVTRIAEFGTSANKVAALGMNLVLLVNLVWSTRLLAGFLRGRRGFADLEHWQTGYLPVYGGWAALVLVALPPLFSFA